jgi:NAD-dependent dihydropyrimidine dehydrogenase PreA subunit
MRVDATFIGIEVDDGAVGDSALAAKLEEVCPVDIYADDGGRVSVVEGNVDECILCEMCVRTGPGRVRVHKLYSDEVLAAQA